MPSGAIAWGGPHHAIRAIAWGGPQCDPAGRLSILHSHPRWMVERWLERFGRPATEALLARNNAPPSVDPAGVRFVELLLVDACPSDLETMTGQPPSGEVIARVGLARTDTGVPDTNGETGEAHVRHQIDRQARQRVTSLGEEVCRALLDHMRRELAVRVKYLDPVEQESIRQLSGQYLIPPWALDQLDDLCRRLQQ